MDNEGLKAVIEELLEVNKLLTLEKAIAKSEAGRLLARVEMLEKRVAEFENQDIEVHTVKAEE